MSFSSAISSCCKINLRLKVTRKRSDGYHELDTIFVPLPFPADNIVIREQGRSGVSFFSPAFPDVPSENNLAVKAALSYAASAGIEPHWHIELDKRVPVAAGLGGGSADAAAVLKLLDSRYKAVSAPELDKIAVKLGADVPFFLWNRPMRALGIGEKLEEFALPENMPEIVIVFPGFPISARWAYQALAKENIFSDDGVSAEDYREAFAHPECADWEYLVRNDLAFAVREKFPLIEIIRKSLLDDGAWCAQVSGSGSSLFALFPDTESAEKAAVALRNSALGTPCTRIFTGGKEF